MEQHFIDKRTAYDKAIGIAKLILKNEKEQRVRELIKMCFQEIQLEEDENIRKEILDFVRANTPAESEKTKSWIGWLNRQKIEIEKL